MSLRAMIEELRDFDTPMLAGLHSVKPSDFGLEKTTPQNRLARSHLKSIIETLPR